MIMDLEAAWLLDMTALIRRSDRVAVSVKLREFSSLFDKEAYSCIDKTSLTVAMV